ncbi:E3 ubiquitin/ISG15 ligase TRIM25 [Bombina bombina]|uniref:E3 ubiquitin/ISG15 ligase TRIM25 n=1 Tax=Bombina bombina TaxID=8345 RepID=UPI00235AD840|nr:E3 ubiquitin/ISG15 ligase TRIM25 [Bombina bombina]
MSIMAQSLDDMAEELTCSICLCLFTTPVTIPCGHNFCYECLDLAWKGVLLEDYCCPQCRCSFDSKPNLRKNTLLSNLVNQLTAARGEHSLEVKEKSEDVVVEEEVEISDSDAVLCDHCMKVAAVMTCLTCMASFCTVHLQPHLESKAYKDHNLKQPLRNLQQRKCAEHNKLLDCFCWEHGKCICWNCIVNHKQCQTLSLQEGKAKKEQHLKKLLLSLNEMIEKASGTREEVKLEQRHAKEITTKKKALLDGEFEEIKTLIEEEQKRAMKRIEEEEKKVNTKFNYTQSVLDKKKNEFQGLKEKVEALLDEEDDLQFLKNATKFQDIRPKEPFKPRNDFNEKLLHQTYRNIVSLKDAIKAKLNNLGETEEARPPTQPHMKGSEADKAASRNDSSDCRGPPQMKNPYFKEDEILDWKLPQRLPPPKQNTPEKPKTKPRTKIPPSPAAAAPCPGPTAPRINPSSREECLKFAEQLTADPYTAHKRVIMSDNFTKLTVTDSPQNYQDNPKRFTHCSQVLCSRGFTHGCYYWEVKIEGGNFSGIGVAYQTIARKGAESRLGRNKFSWCIEWFNGKLQAWHDDKMTDLTSPNVNTVGVLLNCDEGYVAFYSVGKKFGQIYKFRTKFTEGVFPAFWVFSSNTILSFGSTK